MKLTVCAAAVLLAVLPAASNAGLLFSFQQSGANVVMTSSGSINTRGLVQTSVNAWGGTGIEEQGRYDILGGTNVGQVTASFGFNAGTNFSAWATANGPWSSSNFGVSSIVGSKGFATYTRVNNLLVPGIGVEASDIDNSGIWTTDQVWTWNNATLAGLTMVNGTYTVTDARSGEFITIQVGPGNNHVPVPGSLALAGLALFGLGMVRRAKPSC